MRKVNCLHSGSVGAGRRAVSALLLLLGILGAGSALAIDPDKPFHQMVMSRWSVQQGFPQVSALQVLQDDHGYIWASSQNGVARFDGVRFQVFDLHNTPELLSNHIEVLHKDSAGRIWIGSAKGIARFVEGRFETISQQDSEFGIVTSFAEDPEGSMVVGTTRGLWSLDEPDRDLIEGEAVFSLLALERQLLVGGEGRLWEITGDLHRAVELPANFQQARVTQLAAWNGAWWIGTDQGLLQYRDGRFEQPVTAMMAAEIEMLFVDSDQNLWIGAYSALVRLRGGHDPEWITESEIGFNPWIVSATEDHEGNLWLGSKTHALIRVWNGWTQRYSEYEGLLDPFVWSVAPQGAEDNIWVGTNSSLSRIRDGRVETVVEGSQLPHPAAYSLMVDGAGKLWIGTRGGLAWWTEGELQPIPEPLQGLDGLQVNALLETAPGVVWLGTEDGLFTWKDGELIRRAIRGLNENRIRILFADGPDLWIGTENGLARFADGSIEKVEGHEALSNAFVTGIGVLPDGRLAIGTLARGILVGRPGNWLQLDQRHGLPAGGTFYLAAPGPDHLWVGGEAGAYRIRLDSFPTQDSPSAVLQVENLVSASGLAGSQPARCCNGAGSGKGAYHQGAFWLPTLDGVVKLEPGRIQMTATPPRVLVEELRAREQVFPTGRSIELNPDQRDFSVHYTALTYRNPELVSFRYRLAGYESEWVKAGSRRTAYYTNLSPGSYRFEVMAANEPGRWGTISELAFQVEPRFAESGLFKALLAMLVLAAVYGLYRLRVNRLESVQRRLESMVERRTEEMRDLNSRLLNANLELREVSQRDPLTGLFNRRFVMQRLDPRDSSESGLLSREQAPLILVLVDIDRFKQINDTHGHAGGDDLLRQLADLLRQLTRERDFVVRWGGEEFLLIVRDLDPAEANIVAERIRQGIEQHRFTVEGTELIGMTCSLGLSVFPLVEHWIEGDGMLQWEFALELADRALYAVKRAGRNGWCMLRGGEGSPDVDYSVRSSEHIGDLLHKGRLTSEANRPPIRTSLQQSLASYNLERSNL